MPNPSVAPARRFDPARFESFRFSGWDYDRGVAELRYALDDEVEFVERIAFPGATGEPSLPLLDLLHLICGVSYYKTTAPAAIEAPESRFLRGLYTDGLGEFAYVNGIDIWGLRFSVPGPPPAAAGPPAQPRAPLALPRRTAVPIGGGKDSIVTLETLRAAGEPVLALSVGNADPIRRTVEVAGVEHVVVERELSPNLRELNAAGALNGHVPVTAIVSAIACAAAPLYGFDAVAMSNERSASWGNLIWHGSEINHQWSKGVAFENDLRRELARRAPGLELFSLLRPWSELAIGRAFARLHGYDQAFTSCNSVFVRDPAHRGVGWCGDCPKCRFVFLVLAPWMEPARLVAIFERNLLDDAAQLDGFAALLGLGAHKPFECVGEERESAAALTLLTGREAWRDTAVVRALAERAPAVDPAPFLEPSREHLIPERFAGLADAVR